MSFRSVFLSVFLGTAIVVAALVVNARRPAIERRQPTKALAKATGKCAECHRRETGAIVEEFELSKHARKGVTCLDCHRPAPGQQSKEHKGFIISRKMTSRNCASCHTTEYEQFARSRHAGAAWGAVLGAKDFSAEQIALTEKYHPGTVNRPANGIAAKEGAGAIKGGCGSCHSIGRPNKDGSFGTCTQCHSRHDTSVRLARLPSTCGQCHMGPDHPQAEIYTESKHGVLFAAQRDELNLEADPKRLTTRDMPVPTCATCHMSGLEGMKVTHDTSERLSWYLFAAISKPRPNALQRRNEMQEVCEKCHTAPNVVRYFDAAQVVLKATNEKVEHVMKIVAQLRERKLLTPDPFDEPIEFMEFDYWHYYGRTAKHGAFMGGADFVQWHGNYELLKKEHEIEALAAEIEARAGVPAPAGG